MGDQALLAKSWDSLQVSSYLLGGQCTRPQVKDKVRRKYEAHSGSSDHQRTSASFPCPKADPSCDLLMWTRLTFSLASLSDPTHWCAASHFYLVAFHTLSSFHIAGVTQFKTRQGLTAASRPWNQRKEGDQGKTQRQMSPLSVHVEGLKAAKTPRNLRIGAGQRNNREHLDRHSSLRGLAAIITQIHISS